MNIHEYIAKIKYYIREVVSGEIYIVLLIILVGFGGFGLGRLSYIVESKEQVRIVQGGATAIVSEKLLTGNETVAQTAVGGKYVVSKNGSKYHFPWCSGAQRMKDENKIWFNSKEEAELAGYTPAANCKGL